MYRNFEATLGAVGLICMVILIIRGVIQIAT
jgi:hypothetical protein